MIAVNRWLLPMILLLAACTASEPPPYFAKVSGASGNGCGGYAVDEWHVLTADHCTNNGYDRVTVNGSTVISATVVAHWPEIDTAVFLTAEPLGLDSYASPRAADLNQPGYMLGLCPRWVSRAQRIVRYQYNFPGWPERPYCQTWQIAWLFSCGGDSGGFLLQNGQVVGMPVAIDDWDIKPGELIGNQICTVPGEAIAERVEEWRGER